ncbi:MAG: hypothetical protein ACR2MP_25730 [Streptosporangiaceae bacterium]
MDAVEAGKEGAGRWRHVRSDWDHGRYTQLHPQLITMFIRAYPPAAS